MNWLKGVAVLVLVAVAALWVWERKQHADARARIAGVEAYADSLLATIADRNLELDSAYTALDSVEAYADSVIKVAKQNERVAYRDARRTAANLRAALADDAELTAMLDSLTAAYEATIDQLQIQVAQLERVRDEQGNLIDLQKLQLADYEETVDLLEDQIDFWKTEANPPLLQKLWKDAPVYAGVGVLGVILGVAVF